MRHPDSPSILISSGYTFTHIAVSKEGILLDTRIVENRKSSRDLLTILNDLLAQHTYCLQDMVYLTAYTGPAPFTSLRTVITTINGLAYAAQLPLIGIGGTHLLAEEHSSAHSRTLVFLNAFAQEVYAAFCIAGTPEVTLCCSEKKAFDEAHTWLKKHSTQGDSVLMVGNALSYAEHFSQEYTLEIKEQDLPSLQFLSMKAWNLWKAGKAKHEGLSPLYLKEVSVHRS